MGISPVGTWVKANFEEQEPTLYKTSIDNDLQVARRIGDSFAPHENAVPDMNVVVNPGGLMIDATLVEKTAQTVGAFTAPTVNPRIDRIVIDALTGDAEIIAGAEAGSPSAPTIPDEKIPVCQVAFVVGQTVIVNADITDERITGATGAVIVKDRVTSDVIVDATVTETNIYLETISGGLLGINKSLFLYLECGEFDLTQGETVTLRLKYGATTMCSVVIASDACTPVTDANMVVLVRLHADGGTGAQIGSMAVVVGSTQANNPVMNNTNRLKVGGATEDSTADKNLAVTAQFSSVTASKIVMSRGHLRKE